MEHLIRFRTAEGIDGSHIAPTLDDAVTFVERLRNAEGASDVRLFRLTEVAIEFRPYYRVEVGGVDIVSEMASQAAHAPSMIPMPMGLTPSSPTPFAERGQVLSAHHAAMAPPELPDPTPANGRRLFSRT